MTHPHTTRFSTRLRLLCGLALLIGLCIMLGGLARPAHAQSTLSVSDCSSDAQLQADVAQANSDNAGDDITFACSGDIKLTSTLKINGSMTLDGSGQSVTLDGGDSMQVLFKNGGSLTLNALIVAHGSTTAAFGGGLFIQGGTVSISNSTFANNSASDGGGGLFNRFATAATISNSTFANNSAPGGGGLEIESSTLNISGSIVAENTGHNCLPESGGIITDNGYNLSSDSSCGFTGTGSVQNIDPKLAPSGLQQNGGPTQTIALQQGSPASDQIPAASCLATDQRGVTRPDNGETTCDMGAYEFVDPPDNDLGLSNVPSDITVNATSPKGAVMTYTSPTVVDEDSPLPPVNCLPASGSTFAIGTTKVTCTVSDSDDTNSPVSASFTVTVKGAAAQVKDLVTTVNGDHLSSSLQTALDNKLNDVLTAINGGQTATACSELTDFSGYVQSHTGKGITTSQASALMAAARQVQAVLGC